MILGAKYWTWDAQIQKRRPLFVAIFDGLVLIAVRANNWIVAVPLLPGSAWVSLAGLGRSQSHFLNGSPLHPSLHSQSGCPLTMP